MKTCPACGNGFVGFEALCDVCRRRPVQNIEAPKVVTKVTPKKVAPVTIVTSDLAEERDRLLARLAEINAEIGPMTVADRQRSRRARARRHA